MFYLRTFDTVKFPAKNNTLISFSTHTRKWNNTIQFKIEHNEIQYFNAEIYSKLMPNGKNADELELFSHASIYDIVTDNKEIIFQDPYNVCYFLILDDDGIFVPTRFIDLTEDDDLVLYDVENETHYLSSIKELNVVEKDSPLMKEFSNYIIYSKENGLIINDFMIQG
jgi:hypothetical protein